MEEIITWICIILIVFVIAIASGTCGKSEGKELIRQEAVKVGVAHYITDKDGKPTFVWNKVESGLVMEEK